MELLLTLVQFYQIWSEYGGLKILTSSVAMTFSMFFEYFAIQRESNYRDRTDAFTVKVGDLNNPTASRIV